MNWTIAFIALVLVLLIERLVELFDATAHQIEVGKVERRLEDAHAFGQANWTAEATSAERMAAPGQFAGYRRADQDQWRRTD